MAVVVMALLLEPALTVTVVRAAVEVVEALGSARPMPSFGFPGSWLSRRRMPTRLRFSALVLYSFGGAWSECLEQVWRVHFLDRCRGLSSGWREQG